MAKALGIYLRCPRLHMLMLAAKFTAFLTVAMPGLSIFFGSGKYLYPAIAAIETLMLVLMLPALLKLNIFHRRKGIERSVSRRAVLFGGLFFLAYVAAIIRGIFYGADSVRTGALTLLILLMSAATSLMLYAVAARRNPTPDPFRFFQIVMEALAYYCLLNLVGWLLGLQSPAAAGSPIVSESNFLLNLLNIDSRRAFLPFAQGVNTFGIVAAAVMAYGVFHVRDRCKRRQSLAIGGVVLYVAVPGICLLLADSRGAVLFSLAAILLASMHGRALALTALCLSIFFTHQLFAGGGLAGLSVGMGDRSSSATGVLTGRELIWGPVIAELANTKPIHFVGFGIYGQVASGVSSHYASYFSGWIADENMIGVHNGPLQMVLDIGIFGVFAFAMFFYFALTSLSKRAIVRKEDRFKANAAAATIIYLVLQGFTEISLSASHFQAFFILISMVGIFLTMGREPPNGVYGKRFPGRI